MDIFAKNDNTATMKYHFHLQYMKNEFREHRLPIIGGFVEQIPCNEWLRCNRSQVWSCTILYLNVKRDLPKV